MTDNDTELTIINVPDARRYEARYGDQLAGWVDYGRVRSRLVAVHTEVLPEFGGRGIGTALVRHVIADARADGFTITPRCPLFQAHFARHPEDADVNADRSKG
ncbi:MAG: N-acetyltransferase [Chloroflexi bacterium]|nr:N-acetyltransferase [Chloroflexota bacterium]